MVNDGTVRRNSHEDSRDRSIAAGISSLIPMAAPATAAEPESKSQITILYDAFGTELSMAKDSGFSALVEIAGKRISFDTGLRVRR
jgi:7,8-dihydropterin-6-yl-methyl-4-(beta-D-ribofuranosyl)aminobenzene 5'-phosphate synthase